MAGCRRLHVLLCKGAREMQPYVTPEIIETFEADDVLGAAHGAGTGSGITLLD